LNIFGQPTTSCFYTKVTPEYEKGYLLPSISA
jgi:hypothetical protein